MTTTQKKLEELDRLIEGIETAMFTTRRHDGHLVSRPMATQKRIADADLWFVTDADTNKLDELVMDPMSAVPIQNKSREWVSVSGVARTHATASGSAALSARLARVLWDEAGIKTEA